MDGPLETNIMYVLKDQKDLTNVLYKGFTDTYLIGMCSKWIPKEQFKFEKKVKSTVCTQCKGSLNYCQRLANDYLAANEFTDSHTKEGVVEFVVDKVIADKARLPNHMIAEVSRAICVRVGIIDKVDYVRKLVEML